MLDVFSVGVTVQLVDKVSAAMGQITRSLYSGQIAANALNAKLASIKGTFMSGMIMGGGAMALAAPLIMAEKQAEKLEQAMKRLQVSTRANGAEMSAFNKQFSEVSNMTGIFSKPKLAEFAYAMRESGINKEQIKTLLPLYAKGADVMHLLSEGKISADQSAHGFSALAHQFGRYEDNGNAADSMRPIVEAATKMAVLLPGGLNTLVKMGSYVNIIGNRTMGIDPVKLMALQATVAQTSGGTGIGRGQLSAANLANALSRVMPGVFGSGLLEGKSAFAANVLGLADSKGFSNAMVKDKKTGKDVADLSIIMSKFLTAYQNTETAQGKTEFAEKMKANLGHLSEKQAAQLSPMINAIIASHGEKGAQAQLLMNMFANLGGAAKTIFTLFSDPKFQGKYKEMLATATTGPTIEQQQDSLSKTAYFQRIRTATNMETLMSTIGQASLPFFRSLFTTLGDLLYRLNEFAEAHPRIVQMGVTLVATAAGLLALGAAVQLSRAAFMGVAFFAGGLAKYVPTFATAGRLLVTVALGIARLSLGLLAMNPALFFGIIAGVGGTIAIIKNWDNLNNLFKNNIGAIKIALANMILIGNGAIGMLQNLAGAIGGFVSNLLSKVGLADWSKMKLGKFFGVTQDNVKFADSVIGATSPSLLKTLNDYAGSGVGSGSTNIPLKGTLAQANTGPVHIQQTNNYPITAAPHHDTDHLIRKVNKHQDRSNQSLAKSIPGAKGTHNSVYQFGKGQEP